MTSETAQIDILLTLLQFVALSIPAVAILLQVVLQLRSEHGGDENPVSGWDFRAIEGGFIALVLSGVLLAGLVVQSIQSIVGQFGVGLSMFGLILLVLATWITIRRPNYPTEDYETPEEAFWGETRRILYQSRDFAISVTPIARVGLLLLTTISMTSIVALEATTTSRAPGLNITYLGIFISEYSILVISLLLIIFIELYEIFLSKW